MAAFAAKLDLDPLDNLNEEEFEQEFHLDPVEDPEEKLRREEALVENENLIKETNQEYLDGEISWWDEVNEFADLPKVNTQFRSHFSTSNELDKTVTKDVFLSIVTILG